ncbi:MAG: response regulator [Ignavibacteriaceae bacterium]|nr:response regulator [Ignavibacteriaceae bacterium]
MNLKFPCILLAEDNEIIQRIIVHKLEREKYTVVCISSGEKVVETVNSIIPSLIILDLLLPVKNGLTILSELKSSPAISGIPVIIFTSNNNEEMLNNAMKSGAVDYILKPFSPEELMSKIKRYTKLSS